MKTRLSFKLFAAFLLTCLGLVVFMVLAMQHFAARNFTDYVNRTESNRLLALSGDAGRLYQSQRGWAAVRLTPDIWRDAVRSRDEYPESPTTGGLPDRLGGPPPGRPARRPEGPPLGRPPGVTLLDERGGHVAGPPLALELSNHQPVTVGGRTVGWVASPVLDRPNDPLGLEFLNRQSAALYTTGGAILLAAVAAAFFLSRHLLAPVRRLAAGTAAMGQRKFETRLPVVSRDELGSLAADFNAMAQALERQEEMRQRWLSDISHELRTPLAVLRAELEAIQDGVREMDAAQADSLHAEVRQLQRLVEDLHDLALSDAGNLALKRDRVDVWQVIEEAVDAFDLRLRQRGVEVRMSPPRGGAVAVAGEAKRLRQVFANILENALRYAGVPGTLSIGGSVAGGWLKVRFEDSGPGVPEASIDKIFDRLYRVDQSRCRETGGSGLGLAICRGIVEAHGGTIGASNVSGGGLRVEIRLPVADPGPADQTG